MSRKKLTYFISFILLLTSLLLVFANNVPILGSFRWLWAPVFILYILLFNTHILLGKQLRAVLIYGFLYVLILQLTLWPYTNDWYRKSIFEDFYSMLVFTMLFTLLARNKYFEIWANLSRFSVIFLLVTGIMTIVATSINPMVVRLSYSNTENISYLFKYGFGSYGYMTAIVAFFPIIVYLIKKGKGALLPKWALISLLLFFFLVLIKAQIFANILVAFVTLVFSFLGARKFLKSFFYIIFTILIILLIPKSFYVDNLRFIGNSFDSNTLLNQKFNDIANYIENPVLSEDDLSTEAGGRASRYPALWKTFVAAPFFGDASYNSIYDEEITTGAHLYWMSRLALWGVFGFAGYVIVLINIFKPVVKVFSKEFKFYYLLSLGSTILLGFMKNLAGREPYIMLLIIIPGIYFLYQKNLANENNIPIH